MKGQFFSIAGVFVTIAGIMMIGLMMPVITHFLKPEIHVTIEERLEEPSNAEVAINSFLASTHTGMTCREMVIEQIKGIADHSDKIQELLIEAFPDRSAEFQYEGIIVSNGLPAGSRCRNHKAERVIMFPKKVTRTVELTVCYEQQ